MPGDGVAVKHQVFVSSTFDDLRAEREAVFWQLLKDGYIPAGMENFAAETNRGWETITRTIDASDFYVLLIAGRYGSVDGTGISWTEKEYDYAVSKGLPILAFVRDEESITKAKVDKGVRAAQRAKKLAAFIKKIASNHHRYTWRDAWELRAAVASALLKAVREEQRPGWYRGLPAPNEIERLRTAEAKLNRALTLLGSKSTVHDEVLGELKKMLLAGATVGSRGQLQKLVRLLKDGLPEAPYSQIK